MYRLQREFKIIGRHFPSEIYISNRNNVRALQLGIELARQLLSSQRGLKLVNAALAEEDDTKIPTSQPPPTPMNLNDAKRINEAVLRRQKEYLARNSFTVVCEKDADVYGRVDSAEPHVIVVCLEVVISVGRAFSRRKNDKALHAKSQLFLAVTIAHEVLHSMRMSGVGLLHHTTPHVCDHKNVCQTAEVHWAGEGGWAFERAMLGGGLMAITSLPGYTFTPREDYPGMILQVRLERDNDHFEVQQGDIELVVAGLEDWELCFPFQPSEKSGPPVQGRCDWKKLRDKDPASDMAIPTPPPQPPSDRIIEKCGTKREWRFKLENPHLQTLAASDASGVQE